VTIDRAPRGRFVSYARKKTELRNRLSTAERALIPFQRNPAAPPIEDVPEGIGLCESGTPSSD
jgi:hypothetical protein